jgi:type III restriction enzyme
MKKTLAQDLEKHLIQESAHRSFARLVPYYIYRNLRQGWGQRPYQQEAFGRLVYYLEHYPHQPMQQQHLLYHMATGSGKTVIMAGLLLYLYQKGYRHFLFFVNSSNILEKTRQNFLNPHSNKYLFAPELQIGPGRVHISELRNMGAAHPDDINITFCTIQGLHSRLNQPRENSLTYEDFEDQPFVFISDEAHHINADTRRGSSGQADTWEQTVGRIFRIHPQNLMLEFTATADLSHPGIARKYRDKLIYDYPLRSFRRDGYSKEVKVLQADLTVFPRCLQAVLLSQLRLKVFAAHGIFAKPVILFKSRTIRESRQHLQMFIREIQQLSEARLQQLREQTRDEPVIQMVFRYMEERGVSPAYLLEELREDFREEKCLSINSQNESEARQIAVNSLEDEDNPYRAIFAVDKLNEGWDVLNLFDIVRLYDSRRRGSTQAGQTTISEAQLIGRGARYFPFRLSDDQPLYQRKYDENTNTDNYLKICEELYYHSPYNPQYIRDLHTALAHIGLEDKTSEQLSLHTKLSTPPVTKGGADARENNESIAGKKAGGLARHFTETVYTYRVRSGISRVSSVAEGKSVSDDEPLWYESIFSLSEFSKPVLRKAVARLKFFAFDHLRQYLPELRSISEFIGSADYLGGTRIRIISPETLPDTLPPGLQLSAATELLEQLSQSLEKNF